jgi:acylphosphatase
MQVHVVVRGRVQGVGFRWFVRETARELGIAGWVRNRADGGVEVAAEANPDSARRLLDALRQGPPGARVESLDDLGPVREPLDRPFVIAR